MFIEFQVESRSSIAVAPQSVIFLWHISLLETLFLTITAKAVVYSLLSTHLV